MQPGGLHLQPLNLLDESAISHLNIQDIGVNSHLVIDAHIADGTIHFTEGSIDHTAIQNIGVNSHAAIDTHIADGTIHFADTGVDGIPYVREDNAWVTLASQGGVIGPTIDHGDLLGLADDDHINYFFALGRAGGQSMIGGTNPADGITLQGNVPNSGAGRININTGVVLGPYSSSTALYGFDYDPVETFTGAFIGGGLNFSGTHTFSNGTFIYESFRGSPTITTAVNPGFAAYTVLQALPQLNAGSGAGHNPLNPLVVNCAPTVVNGFAGTRTVATSGVINGSPQLRTTVNGATMNCTNMTGFIWAPKYSTAAGSTVNFGTVRGIHGQNILPGLFQPGNGAEIMTRYALVDCDDITFGGVTERAVVRSSMSAGTGKYFLYQNSNALSEFNNSWIHFNDGFGVQFGDTPVSILHYWDDTQAALRWNNTFGVGAESLYLRPSATDTWTFQHHNGGAADIGLGFNVNAVSFGVIDPVPNSNNWFVMFSGPNQREVFLNGEYSDVLWTAGGSINVAGHTVSDLQAFKINSPSILLNGGTIDDISNLFVQAMPSFGATRTQSLRVLGRGRIDGPLNLGSHDEGSIGVNTNDLQLGPNNAARTMNLIDATADFDLSGIDSSFGFGAIGEYIAIRNIGTFDISLTHQDTNSAAANRFICPEGLPYVIHPDRTVWIWYDDQGVDRWRVDSTMDHPLRTLHLSGDQFRKGATAPTDVTIGTTPTVPALLFDATNELASLYHSLPVDTDLTQDIILRLQFSLAAAETNGDTCDFTCDYVAPTLATGGGIAKASTQVTGQFTAVTGRLAAGDIYVMDITFTAGDATNPLAAAVGLAFEIHLTNTTGVAAIHLIDGDLIYTALRS